MSKLSVTLVVEFSEQGSIGSGFFLIGLSHIPSKIGHHLENKVYPKMSITKNVSLN